MDVMGVHMRILAFLDPDGKYHFEIKGIDCARRLNENVYYNVIRCENWVTENCPSATWKDAEGYSPSYLYIDNSDELIKFLAEFNQHIKQYNECFFIEREGKHQRSFIDKSNLKVKFNNIEELLKNYANNIGEFGVSQYKNNEPIKQRIDKGLKKFFENFKDDRELWSYNDIGFLCGSSGYCIVDYNKRIVYDVYVVWRS